MFYGINPRNSRTTSALAVTFLLIGVMVFLGFLFMGYSIGSDGEINWSMITVFIPVFAGVFIPIIAVISEQKRNQTARNTVQNQQLEIKMEQQAQERVYTQVRKPKKSSFLYCSLCGEKMDEEARFCPQCGTEMRY